jgi:hypothetical protein
MNAERLHALARRIDAELNETEAIVNLQSLAAALQQVMNQPSAQSQQRVGDMVITLQNGIAKSSLDKWSPAWMELLKDIGFEGYLGQPLLERVKQILQTNEITPAIAKPAIDQLAQKLTSLKDAVQKVMTSFAALNIGADTLAPGECEVGVLIPRGAVDNELGALSKELKELDWIIRTIREVATGEGGPIEIRTVSSTDFFVFLAEHPAVAASIALIVERLINGYKTILEVRKLHGELTTLMGKKSIKEVEKFADTEMTTTIKAIVEEVIKQYPKKDTARKNELRTALEGVLRKLADRIDRGFNIEIRIEPIQQTTEPDQPADDEASKKAAELASYQQTIEAAAKAIQFSHRDGPPILHLEDAEEAGPSQKTPEDK